MQHAKAPAVDLLAGFGHGMRSALPLALSAAAFGMTLGLLAVSKGLTAFQLGAMSAWVFAGSSQVVAVEMWATPLPIGALIAATVAINARHVLMGATLAPWLIRMPLPAALLACFFLVDEAWALAMAQVRSGSRDAGFLFGAGLTFYSLWLAATLVGHRFGALVTSPESLGLDFVGIAVFLCLLVLLRPSVGDVLPFGVTIAVTLVHATCFDGPWHVLIGALTGALVAALRDAR